MPLSINEAIDEEYRPDELFLLIKVEENDISEILCKRTYSEALQMMNEWIVLHFFHGDELNIMLYAQVLDNRDRIKIVYAYDLTQAHNDCGGDLDVWQSNDYFPEYNRNNPIKEEPVITFTTSSSMTLSNIFLGITST